MAKEERIWLVPSVSVAFLKSWLENIQSSFTVDRQRVRFYWLAVSRVSPSPAVVSHSSLASLLPCGITKGLKDKPGNCFCRRQRSVQGLNDFG